VASPASLPPLVLVVMGVSGSGKTTIAHELVRKLGWPFQEGDDLHPPANVAKMHAGRPLTDEDRWPWLDAIARWIDAQLAARAPGIVTCSALKRIYRDRLIDGRKGVRLVYLHASRALLAERLAHRTGHFMPASLLDSQLATLEPPAADEHPLAVDLGESPERVADTIIAMLQAEAAADT
jgi:carbohydrate kinase (thermoresistant glucokinase family)